MPATSPDAPRALVCEDEPVTLAALAEMCEQLGYGVVARCRQGNDAIEAALTHRPDLVLMDIELPDGNGIEATRSILAEHPATVLIVTGHVTDAFVNGAREAGVAGYLVKPVTIGQLQAAVGVALSCTERLQQAAAEAQTAQQALAGRKLIERAKGLLMEAQHLTEREAYRAIQKRSQDERRSMTELAEEIIREHQAPPADDDPGGRRGTAC
jgi:two-component system, response regulator PdtaR